MGLFINDKGHQAFFENRKTLIAPNQESSIINPMTDFMQRQKDANTSLQGHIKLLEKQLENQRNVQQYQAQELRHQLSELKFNHIHHEKFEGQAIGQLTKLDRKMDVLNKVNAEIVDKVEDIDEANEVLVIKMNEQLSRQEKLSSQFAVQKISQEATVIRLDNQEALTEKIIRQLDHVRSILYERTHFLAEKIESSYELTSSYIQKVITNSNKPISLLLEKQQEKNVDQKKD